VSRSPDCIIVGGGVIGLAAARRLARAGCRVLLLDRRACGRCASWSGAGIVSPCNPHRADPLSIIQERSVRGYADWCSALHIESGIDPEYDPRGELQVALTPDFLSMLRGDGVAGAGVRGADGSPAYRMLDAAAARECEPALSEAALGALECRLTGSVRNPRLLRALVESAGRAGADIREGSAVTGFDWEGDRVTGVRLGEESIAADRVILCAGAWSAAIDPRIGAAVPVFPVRGQIVLLMGEQPVIHHVIARGKRYLVPRRDGRILVGATEEPEAGFVDRPDAKGIATLTQAALTLVPSLGRCVVEATWAGLRPATADARPYIGEVPGARGVIAATGHFRAGLTLAPVTAEIVEHLVFGREYDVDLRGFAPGRARSPEPVVHDPGGLA
jgi:glycine oxidase